MLRMQYYIRVMERLGYSSFKIMLHFIMYTYVPVYMHKFIMYKWIIVIDVFHTKCISIIKYALCACNCMTLVIVTCRKWRDSKREIVDVAARSKLYYVNSLLLLMLKSAVTDHTWPYHRYQYTLSRRSRAIKCVSCTCLGSHECAIQAVI